MSKQKKPTFVDDGYEINNGCRIRRIEIINGFHFYQVTLQRISGKPIRRSFINAEQARSFSEQAGIKGADGGMKVLGFIDPDRFEAVKATTLDLINAGLQKASAHFYETHNESTAGVGALVEEFIAEKQERTDRGELPAASLVDTKHFLKRFSKEFGHRAVGTVTTGEIDGFFDEVNGAANQRAHRLHISTFFNWAVSRKCLSFNPIGPTFVDDGYEINHGCRIRQTEIANGFHYYQVTLQRISGKPIRRRFITARQARSFAGKTGAKGTDGETKVLGFIDPDRINAVKATMLDLYNANFRKAA
ncbi:MAG: hypothetical protein DRP64_07940 [Verrucomicrobia bacterium]|nr:MAG: hypothetical protein DRP64_07940 [Verrucomicrobiota bacterium]